MYLQEEIVSFKETKRFQRKQIERNKIVIRKINKLIDCILNDEYENDNINQTYVKELNDNSLFYIRKINKWGTHYYNLQKTNKNNATDYKFDYYYGHAMVNTEQGIKKIKTLNLTQDTIAALCFDLKSCFKNNKKIITLVSELECL